MSKVEKFEDLIAWQKSRELTRNIYEITRKEPFTRDFGLSSQIQRCAVSIMSNVAEGFDRAARGEFHHFLVIAKGSCAELRSQLYIALDIGYISQPEFDRLNGMAVEVARILGGLRSSVANQRSDK